MLSDPSDIFTNAQVITMDSAFPTADTLVVGAGRILSVGEAARYGDLKKTGAVIHDLGGKTLVPGFIEPHSHISFFARQLLQVDCSADTNRDIQEILERIGSFAAAVPQGQWVVGFGFDDSMMPEKRHLTRADLDAASPDKPTLIFHISGHLFYANSLGLARGGITPRTPQPAGGEIHRDENGEPTGLLLEPAAVLPLVATMPPATIEEYLEVLPQAADHYHQAGITSCHEGAVGYTGEGPAVLRAFQDLTASGQLRLRVYLTLMESFYSAIIEQGLLPGFGSENLRLGSVKAFQDGSIQGFTAALREPYHTRPGFTGEFIMPQAELNRTVEKYHSQGMQMAIHGNGDRAIESIIEAIERAAKRHPGVGGHRHMIIHCQMASDSQLSRMRALGVIPNFFVNHVYFWGDRHEKLFLGPERARRIDPLQSALRLELPFVLHSDKPVTRVDPLFSMHNAVNRVTREGNVLGAEQRIDPYEALKAYTVNAAFCSREEELKGSLSPGKLADFVVLSENPLTVTPGKIKDIAVEQTFVGGTAVYTRAEGRNSA